MAYVKVPYQTLAIHPDYSYWLPWILLLGITLLLFRKATGKQIWFVALLSEFQGDEIEMIRERKMFGQFDLPVYKIKVRL